MTGREFDDREFEELCERLRKELHSYVLLVWHYEGGFGHHIDIHAVDDEAMALAAPKIGTEGDRSKLLQNRNDELLTLKRAGHNAVLLFGGLPGEWDCLHFLTPEDGVTVAHKLNDARREIAVQFSNGTHKGQYVWEQADEVEAAAPMA